MASLQALLQETLCVKWLINDSGLPLACSLSLDDVFLAGIEGAAVCFTCRSASSCLAAVEHIEVRGSDCYCVSHHEGKFNFRESIYVPCIWEGVEGDRTVPGEVVLHWLRLFWALFFFRFRFLLGEPERRVS